MWKIAAVLSLCSVNALAAPKFDSSALEGPTQPAAQKSNRGQTVQEKRGPPQRKKNLGPVLSDEDDQRLRAAIDSYAVILKRTKDQKQRNALVLGRAKSSLTLAQRQLFRAKTPEQESKARGLLDLAGREATGILNAPQVDNATKADAHFILGLVGVYSDRYSDAVAQFDKAVDLDPRSKNAAWMNFFIAEELFENGKYAEAIERYRLCFTATDIPLRKMTYYKMAWSYVNIDQNKAAEDLFLRLAKLPNDDMAKDAMKDLAFLVSKTRQQSDIVELASKNFQELEQKLTFLRAVYGNLEAQGFANRKSIIYRTLLTLEPDSAKRFRLQVNAFANSRKEYASNEHYTAFVDVKQALAKDRPDDDAPDTIAGMSSLESEVQFLIRSLADTFSGRIQNPEKIPKNTLGGALKGTLTFHLKEFPKSKVRAAIFSLALDVCGELKDWRCVNQAALLVAAEKQLDPAIRLRAQNDRLAALEELTRTSADEFGKEFRKALEDYVAARTDQSNWTRIAKRLSEVYMASKDYDDAIEVLEKVYQKDKKAETWHALQWARFSDEQYEGLIQAQETVLKNVVPDAKLAEILREAALKLTLEARSSGDLPKYGVQIGRFMRYNRDPAKARLARKDYVAFMIEKSAHAEATKALLEFPKDERTSADYIDALNTVCAYHLRNGAFNDVLRLLPPEQRRLSPDSHYNAVLAELALHDKVSPEAMNSLNDDRRHHLLALLALFKPDQALAHYRKETPTAEIDVTIALTALRMKKGSWTFVASPSEARLIGNSVPASMRPQPISAPESAILKTRFPNPPARSTQKGDEIYARELQKLMEQARNIRTKIVAELAGKPPAVQLRMLSAARQYEAKVGQLILASPIPAGLMPEQMDEYNKAIAGVAAEFTDQAGEFAKLESAAADAVKKEEAQTEQKNPGIPPMDIWPWPSGSSRVPVKVMTDYLKAGRALAAAVMADVHRKELGEDAYYELRAGILLYGAGGGAPAVRRYVWEELNVAGMKGLIAKWQSLVH